MEDREIVRLEHVCRVYRQGRVEVRAVDRVSFSLPAGDFAALCGPSGSGKTTILNMIGCLDHPDEGRVFLDGHDLSRLSATELAALRRDRIGFVFQSYNLIPVLTAAENAAFVLELQGRPREEIRARVDAVLADVGLADLAARYPDDLSGGQQQRVAIARALAASPAIILADEPTANIDSATADGLLDLMESLNREKGITFLFSTHDERVMKRARRLLTLRDGILEDDVVRSG